MSYIKLTDPNKIKCDILKEVGIMVSNYIHNKRVIYTVTIKGMPNIDDFFENRFNSINDILKAFSDMLVNHNYMLLAA